MPNDGERVAAKAALRSRMRQRLTELSSDERDSRSKQICERIVPSPEWQEAKRIVLFVPLRSEPDISGLNEEARSAQKVITTIAPTIRVEAELQFGTDEIDLIVVPGLAFSRDCHRLGRGGGFFDRLLAGPAAEAYKLGVCFDFQLLESIPIEPHDIVMDTVVTEEFT
ncbi:MAG TPA: 5-formyltetrahydrofolate cyclo-ligase [Chthoniobacterales bacterium]|jgi:5-formyltetrahydrofolate cyclo-ligase